MSYLLQQVQQDFRTGEIEKKNAEQTMTLLKKKLEEKQLQIEMIKNPSAFKTELQKNFLASEKLASVKKKRAISQRRPELKSKKNLSTYKRLKSAMKTSIK